MKVYIEGCPLLYSTDQMSTLHDSLQHRSCDPFTGRNNGLKAGLRHPPVQSTSTNVMCSVSWLSTSPNCVRLKIYHSNCSLEFLHFCCYFCKCVSKNRIAAHSITFTSVCSVSGVQTYALFITMSTRVNNSLQRRLISAPLTAPDH